MNEYEMIDALEEAKRVIDLLYAKGQEDAMYTAMGVTGASVEDALSGLIHALHTGEVAV